MRRNSRSLLATIGRPAAFARAAIPKSSLPIGCPWDSSDAGMVLRTTNRFSAEKRYRPEDDDLADIIVFGRRGGIDHQDQAVL
jgi:hypothetical protein